MDYNSVSSDMIRGHMDTIILLSLIDGDKHTNQIREEIENRTDGKYAVKQGTFYSCLERIKKQGFVEEYRSSSIDGIRRKYYKLTEKGKKYIENNRNEWFYSKNIINDLMNFETSKEDMTPPSSIEDLTNKKAEKQESNETVFEDFVNSLDDENADKNEENQDNSEVLTINTDVPLLSQITFFANNNNENIVEEIPEQSVIDEKPLDAEEVVTVNPDNQTIDMLFTENQSSVESETVNTLDEFESKTSNEIPEKIAETTDDISNNSMNAFEEELFANDEEIQIPEIKPEDFTLEPSGPNEYKEILSRLFPSKKVEEEPLQLDYQEPTIDEDFTTIDDDSYLQQTLTNDLPADNQEDYSQRQNYAFDSSDNKYDFSDLYEMAEKEGFKIKVSSMTNKKEIGKILINKLRFHTSLLFFVIFIFEALIIGLFGGKSLEYGLGTYFAIIGAVALLPIVCGTIYLINPDLRVKEISSFKNAIELSLILALNLILIICAIAVLSGISFSDSAKVITHVVIPIVAVLDLPIYFVIKYSLLEKTIYLSK